MRYITFIILTLFITACNQADNNKGDITPTEENADSANVNQAIDSVADKAKSTLLMNASGEVLIAIKERNFKKLSTLIDPETGLRFSPYGFIDTAAYKVFSAAQLLSAAGSAKKMSWGEKDGSGEPIKLTLKEYVDRYVYDKDFQNAEKKSINVFLAGGNSLNNLKEVYPASDFVEYYFPGFDPKFEGMDWKTLRLVFKIKDGTPWLVAIVHDEWTI